MIEPGGRGRPNAGSDAVMMYPDGDPGLRTVDVPTVVDEDPDERGEDPQSRMEDMADRADDAALHRR